MPTQCRKKLLCSVLVCLFFILQSLFVAPSFALSDPPLTMGMLPYLSPRTLFKNWEPLRAHLELKMGRPISFATAPNYVTFSKRTIDGVYDVVLSTSHLGRLAQVDAGLVPLARPEKQLHGIFIAMEQGIDNLQALKGKRLATPDPLAIITLLGHDYLADMGLKPGVDFESKAYPSHNAAALAVQKGQADLAVVSVFAYKVMRKKITSNLIVLGRTEEVPSPVIFIANPKLPKTDHKRLQAAIIGFQSSGDIGEEFFKRFGYAGMGIPSDEEMGFLDRFLPATRKILGHKP
ncbi:MAG: phosphate/phosphite/phosphonate ABC transporter substrate-binding protein [Gammaproteobacteria bacterium]|nr:phosphate/phosphite/phosphonate ABC transporter substrate-binding protein [Gammaproteobacteria bacterium]